MTKAQLLDGGAIARMRTAVNVSTSSGEGSGPGGLKVLYGMGMAADPRLRAALKRENFFLSVLAPRTGSVVCRSVMSYFSWHSILVLGALMSIYGSMAYKCAYTHPNGLGNTFCNGGPIGDGGEHRTFTFDNYRAAILNSLAAMLLSFYVSSVVALYKEACEQARIRVDCTKRLHCSPSH